MFTMLILLLGFLSSTDAVTMIQPSDYAIPPRSVILLCNVLEEAVLVQFYRRPDLSNPVGEIQVSDGQCYNASHIVCDPSACSCVPTTDGNRGTEFRWAIQPHAEDDGSVWTCRRFNYELSNASEDSADFTLHVAAGPWTAEVSPADMEYTMIEGNTLPDITCTADCRPDCTFVWTKPDNTNFTVTPVLSLGQLDRSEQGTYRCTGWNEVGSSNTNVTVVLNYGPGNSISLSSNDTTYTKNEGGTLPDITCTADCKPECIFVWTKPDNTNFTASALLSLEQLERSEHGMYRCTAWNDVGKSTITMNVIVQYGPGDSIRFVPQENVVHLVENDTVPNVTCSADCRPMCNYSWSKGEKHYDNPLSLSTAVMNVAGEYTCTVGNIVNHGIRTLNIIIT